MLWFSSRKTWIEWWPSRFEVSIIVAMEIQTNQVVKHQAPPPHLSVVTLPQNTHINAHSVTQALLMRLSGDRL